MLNAGRISYRGLPNLWAIADRISTHFVAHPELYEQAQYQGLATYRSQSIASNQGKSGKSSAEKDAEDALA